MGALLKVADGTLTRSGNMLVVSGIDQSDWKVPARRRLVDFARSMHCAPTCTPLICRVPPRSQYKFFNGNFKTEIEDGMTPRDPAVLDAAMALVE